MDLNSVRHLNVLPDQHPPWKIFISPIAAFPRRCSVSWPVPPPAPFIFVLLEAILILSSAAAGSCVDPHVPEMEKKNYWKKKIREGLAALIVSSGALKWAVIRRVSLYFQDKSKQPSFRVV